MAADKQQRVEFSNGQTMPILGLGTWKSEPGKVTNAVKTAIAAGYRHIDCAYCYFNEAEVGAGISAKINDGTVKREDLFITSKLFQSYHKLGDVEIGLKKSLDLLKLDYLDLFLLHWPLAVKRIGDDEYPRGADGKPLFDDTHFTESWKGMEKLVEKGLVKSIGLSNFTVPQIKEVLALPNKVPIANLQIEITPYLTQTELLDFCKSKNISVTAYSPLGSGDRDDAKPSDPVLMEDPIVGELAKRNGKSVAQILIRYHLQQGVACVPKSVTPSRIQENFESLNFKLSDGDVAKLKALDKNFRYCTYEESWGHPLHPFDGSK